MYRICRRWRKGFTLIEMLVVLAVVTILLGISGSSLYRHVERAHQVADAAYERAANVAAMSDYMLNHMTGIFNYDPDRKILTNSTVTPYGKTLQHHGQSIVTTIGSNGEITVEWSSLHGAPIMQSFGQLLSQMNFMYNGNKTAGEPFYGNLFRSIDSEGDNGTTEPWGTRIMNLLRENGDTVEDLSYAIKVTSNIPKSELAKPDLTKSSLKEGDVVIYYGPKITAADIGKSISVRAYDAKTDTYSTIITTVAEKTVNGNSFPVIKIP